MRRLIVFPLACFAVLAANAAGAEELVITQPDLKLLVHERMFKGQDKIGSSFPGCSAEASNPRVALQNGRLLLTIYGKYDCLAMSNGLDISATASIFAKGDRFGLSDFQLVESADGLLNMLLGRVLSARKEVVTRLQEALARKRDDESELEKKYLIQHLHVAADGIHLRYVPVGEITPKTAQ